MDIKISNNMCSNIVTGIQRNARAVPSIQSCSCDFHLIARSRHGATSTGGKLNYAIGSSSPQLLPGHV